MSKNKSKERPGHYTESDTRKYQANGHVSWARVFKAAAGKGREGEGIRAALAYAASHEDAFLAWAGKHSEAIAPARSAAAVKAKAKAAAPKAKAAKAPKAKAAAKAPKAKATKAKAPKAPKEPEQVDLTGVS